jgi:Class III cytochrome C family
MLKRSVHGAGVLLLVAVVGLVVSGWVQHLAEGGESGKEVRRTFRIRVPGHLLPDLERTHVEFGHELHTKVLGADSCTTCHETGADGDLVFRFVEYGENASLEDIADAYHDACISCHEEKSRGPRVCAECHFKSKPYVNAVWHTVDMDFGQHQKHSEAMDGKCGECHHAYDEASGELVYIEGQERSCRDCHRAESREGQPSLRDAAHGQCLTCHIKRDAAGETSGPLECAGCHDPVEPFPVAYNWRILPRLERDQPDKPVILIADNTMPAVPFDHLRHERIARNCRTCHHESLEACSNCHTLQGDEKGGFVKLADAYHRPTSSHSCVGCHERQKTQDTCAVCHGSMQHGLVESSCDTCHSGPLAGGAVDRPLTDVAGLLPDDLPDVLHLSQLKDRFGPVEFPHRAIVEAMNKTIGDNRLANVFHGSRAVVCASCHHHSPLGAKPPSCARCHLQPFDPHAVGRPGLMGAYHQQCVGCHRDMKIGDYRDCRECHLDDVPMPGYPKGGAR